MAPLQLRLFPSQVEMGWGLIIKQNLIHEGGKHPGLAFACLLSLSREPSRL